MAEDKKAAEDKAAQKKAADVPSKARTQQQTDAQPRMPQDAEAVKAKVRAANPETIPVERASHEEIGEAASKASLNAQVRHTRSPEEVGNEFTPQDQGPAISTAEVVTEAADDSEVRKEEKSSSAKTRTYVVGGRGIHTAEGKKKAGEKVELTAEEARRFNKAKAILPYIPEEGEDD